MDSVTRAPFCFVFLLRELHARPHAHLRIPCRARVRGFRPRKYDQHAVDKMAVHIICMSRPRLFCTVADRTSQTGDTLLQNATPRRTMTRNMFCFSLMITHAEPTRNASGPLPYHYGTRIYDTPLVRRLQDQQLDLLIADDAWLHSIPRATLKQSPRVLQEAGRSLYPGAHLRIFLSSSIAGRGLEIAWLVL